MTHHRLELAIAVTLAVTALAAPARADLYWTDTVSEERGGPSALCSDWNEGAVGFGCTGRYCDNVRMLCETMPYGITMERGSYAYSGWFSEEHDSVARWRSEGWYPYSDENYHVCHSGGTSGIVTGIRCSGRYCDDISVECARPVVWRSGEQIPVPFDHCSWSDSYSEEQGWVDFGFNRYITGIECEGRYCDNKRFYVCSLSRP